MDLGAALALALALGGLGATCGGPGLVAVGLTIVNVRIAGPPTIAAGGAAAYTVTYDVKLGSDYSASVNLVVRDQDLLPEVNPFRDETLVVLAATRRRRGRHQRVRQRPRRHLRRGERPEGLAYA